MPPSQKSKKPERSLEERAKIADLKDNLRILKGEKKAAHKAAVQERRINRQENKYEKLSQQVLGKSKASPPEPSAAAPEPVQAAVLEAPEPVQAVAQQPVPVQDFIDLTDD